jgi:hypothetical protein
MIERTDVSDPVKDTLGAWFKRYERYSVAMLGVVVQNSTLLFHVTSRLGRSVSNRRFCMNATIKHMSLAVNSESL